MMAVPTPTYMHAVQDAIEIVKKLAGLAAPEIVPTRVLLSELESLHPQARKRYREDRCDTAEAVILQLAIKIVRAADNDIRLASQRASASRDKSAGNVCASVEFSPTEVIRWTDYAAAHGHQLAKDLREYLRAKGGIVFNTPRVVTDEAV